MKYLLDTHILLWWLSEPEKIQKKTREIIEDSDNTLVVSAATFWELAIKQKLGRIRLPYNLFEILQQRHFHHLNISPAHAIMTIDLPELHNDPFDRMLIAQAKSESLVLITRDKVVKRYPVATLLG